MKNLSLKLKDDIYEETEKITRQMNMPRNAYINLAVAFYNALRKRAELRKALKKESLLVRENSMEILDVFENLDEEI